MSYSAILEKINQQAQNASPLGDTIKFILEDKTIYIDGTGESNKVSEKNDEASCVIIADQETFSNLQAGSLNPMMAVMSGKIKIKGDMGLAMKLQSLL
jgi:putative sterol carrier protein